MKSVSRTRNDMHVSSRGALLSSAEYEEGRSEVWRAGFGYIVRVEER